MLVTSASEHGLFDSVHLRVTRRNVLVVDRAGHLARPYSRCQVGEMKLLVGDHPTMRQTTGNSPRYQRQDWDTFSVDGLRIHFPSQTVHVDGQLMALTDTEYSLLRHLVRNAGRVLS